MATVEDRPESTQDAIDRVAETWQETVRLLPGLKKKMREEAAAKLEQEIAQVEDQMRDRAARDIHQALQYGATKSALRRVTTKDHWNFEEYVERGNKLAEGGK